MTIHTADKRRQPTKIQVDLRGPQGNAYCILGLGRSLAKQLDKDWAAIEKEMTSGEYENLLQVFDREFGMFVDLWR